MAASDAEKRRERLAAALRENLKRRKAHKRGQGVMRPAENVSGAELDTSSPDTASRPAGTKRSSH